MLDQRARFGVIIPSTNTVVEHDLTMIRPRGVTFHYGRMYIEHPELDSDDDFVALLAEIRGSIDVAVRDVMTCRPTSLLMGMSAETFWGGLQGNAEFEGRVKAMSVHGGASPALSVTTGAASCRAALEAFGARRISVFSPYQPVADLQVGTFFTEAGFEVAAITGLRCSSATAIAEVTAAEIRRTINEIDDKSVDAIVQVGTNLSFIEQAAHLETELGKPVIAINAATLWHGLRTNGIDDRLLGVGRLLSEH